MAPHIQNGIHTHGFIKTLILIKIESVTMMVIYSNMNIETADAGDTSFKKNVTFRWKFEE